MTQWDCNKTMKKLARLNVVSADSVEGKEVIELITAIPHMEYGNIFNSPDIDALYMLIQYAYALGMDRGKRLERKKARDNARVLA